MSIRNVVSIVLCVLALSVPALAAPPSSEFSLTGEFVQTHATVENPWSVNIGLLFGKSLKVGPEVVIGSADELNRMGVGTEWNVLGPRAAITPFVGGSALYFEKSLDNIESYVVTARAGFKVRIGPSAYIKAYAFDVVDGRGKDETDLGAAAGVVALF